MIHHFAIFGAGVTGGTIGGFVAGALLGVLYGAHHGMQVDNWVHKPLWWFHHKILGKSAKEWRW